MAETVIEKVKTLILCGPTADAIENAIIEHPNFSEGHPEIIKTNDLAESIDLAHSLAVSGDIVTLSPACASFDAFPNFAARGKFFKEKVMAFNGNN